MKKQPTRKITPYNKSYQSTRDALARLRESPLASLAKKQDENGKVHDYRCWHIAYLRGDRGIEDRCTCDQIHEMQARAEIA